MNDHKNHFSHTCTHSIIDIWNNIYITIANKSTSMASFCESSFVKVSFCGFCFCKRNNIIWFKYHCSLMIKLYCFTCYTLTAEILVVLMIFCLHNQYFSLDLGFLFSLGIILLSVISWEWMFHNGYDYFLSQLQWT